MNIVNSIKKIISSWKTLPFEKRSSLTATWIQVVSVVLGIVIALLQLNSLHHNQEYTKVREAEKLIEKYWFELHKNKYNFDQFFIELSELALRKNLLLKEPLNKILNLYSPKMVEEYDRISTEYFFKIDRCVYIGLCDKKVVSDYFCGEALARVSK